MVCVAAFIVLCLISVFVAILSIFRRDIGKRYWKTFKKAWHCVGKKVRLQKCETDFKDDVKNSILSHFILKKPSLVKPLSALIEVLSVFIVLISVWSLVEATKAGLGLAVLGTCNVSAPSSCALGAEACTVDQAAPKTPLEGLGRWFTEWGEIFANIPDRFKSWSAQEYLIENTPVLTEAYRSAPLALDIMDPLCSVCSQSYKNQKAAGFFQKHNTYFLFYPIMLDENTPKFPNSDLIVKYLHATTLFDADRAIVASPSITMQLVTRLFTEMNPDHINYQDLFRRDLDTSQAEALLQQWLADFGKDPGAISEISQLAHSERVQNRMQTIDQIVRTKIRVRGIPTALYDNRKHYGLFKP